MMRKEKIYVTLISLVLASSTVYSQVGVNTETPAATLHIKGEGSTSAAKSLLIENANADLSVSVTGDGKVGIGMAPSAADASVLQLNGPITVKNAGHIESGTGYVLTTSDGTGQARWEKNTSLTPTVIGTLGSGSNNGFSGNVNSSGRWLGVSIELPPGTWIIQTNMLLYSGTVTSTQSIWQRLTWSDIPNTQNNSTDILSGRYVSGNVPANSQFGLAVGTTLLTNGSTVAKTYYLNINTPQLSGGVNVNWNKLGSQDWSENAVVAYPAVRPN